MPATQEKTYSIQEYLQLEESADFKSEYLDGHIIPMAGGTTHHNQIALNVSTELNFAFKKLDYRVYMGDVRLWIPDKRTFTYPDVTIVAEEPIYFENRTDTITNPLVIFEILSKSTQAYDREGKFTAYRTLPTFEEYILIAQHQIYAEQFAKAGEKRWSFQEYDENDSAIALNSVAVQLAFTDIYNKVETLSQKME